jgi:hypothetical protein
MSKNPNRARLAELTDAQIDQILDGTLDVGVRVGFELEFQKLDGKTASEWRENCKCVGKPDTTAMQVAAMNILEEKFCFMLATVWVPRRGIAAEYITAALAALPSTGTRLDLLRKLSEIAPKEYWNTISKMLDKCDVGLLESTIATLNPNDYTNRECSCKARTGFEVMRKGLHLPKDMELKSDASVKGGEITTLGPNTVSYCIDKTKEVFDNNALTCDAGCSYHIHFSLDGMRHSYSKSVQAEAIRFMVEKLSREGAPKFIAERFKNFKYFKPELSEDKYSFVSYNDEYGTWEFRFFGNVGNLDDAKWCFRTLLETMRHVYLVLNEGERSFRSILSEALSIPGNKLRLTDFFDNYGPALLRGEITFNDAIVKEQEERYKHVDSDDFGVA